MLIQWIDKDHIKLVADWGGVAGQMPARRQPSDPCSPLFTHSFLSCFPCVLSPVVVIRLLLHRLLTTAAHLQRWKSCASRSSFASASAHEVPRSPRSRASSTDTEPNSLRKRRKVSIFHRGLDLKMNDPWKSSTMFYFERSEHQSRYEAIIFVT